MRSINDGLNTAKKRVSALKGRELFIVINKGRNKLISFNGHVADLYPSIFTVLSDDKRTYSLSYSDIVTGNVRFYRPRPGIETRSDEVSAI